MARRGWFIALEGVDGSGKSTQARLLAERCDGLLTREPGGTDIGVRIRQLLLDPETGVLDPRAEALLMAADRAQHVAMLVRPALSEGRTVITDRYVPSSVAYQGHARGLDPREIEDLSSWATESLWPDLIVLLEPPPDVLARQRRELDRLEREGAGFHDRVAEGYRLQAAADPQRWAVVDACGSIRETADAIWATVTARLDGFEENR